jgi:hypothetical protein
MSRSPRGTTRDHRSSKLPEDDQALRDHARCCVKKCPNLATHSTSYTFTTVRVRKVCEDHAVRFAQEHSIPITEDHPTGPPRQDC